jgi:hypothetical protein
VSATGSGGARGYRAGWAAGATGLDAGGDERTRGRDQGPREDFAVLGQQANGLGSSLLFFPISISSLKQANTFEFKPGFESKHPKTMHRHECHTHTIIYLI